MKKVNFRCLFAWFITMLAASQLMAQQPVRRCGTVEYNRLREQQNPALAEARRNLDVLVRQYMNEHKDEPSRAVITIPVVVHLIYCINLQNIPDAQIQSQIDVLNRDFARLNADTASTPAAFSSVAGNPDIQFCLATRDPNGQPTNGIERRQNCDVPVWPISEDMKYYSLGGLNGWDKNRYLNIWLCNLESPYLGFTQMPPAFGPDTLNDGCVITHRVFGDTQYVSPPFHLGRTTTHEIGHWLGLYHIWGDDNGTCPPTPGNDDQISDTPPQAEFTNGCPAFPLYDSCTTNYPGIMYMNYMDYSDDACMNMFTQEQSAVMNTALTTYRAALFNSDGCVPVVGVNELEHEKEITLYPNPAGKELRIKNTELRIESLEAYDFLGRQLFSQQPTASSQQLIIDISSLAEGTYFLKITSLHSVRTARFTIAR